MFTCIICDNNSKSLAPKSGVRDKHYEVTFDMFRYHLLIAGEKDQSRLDYLLFCNDCCNDINKIRTDKYRLEPYKLHNNVFYQQEDSNGTA